MAAQAEDGSAPVDVRRAETADLDAMAAVLAASFFDDPVMTWVFGDDDRLGTLRLLWRTIGSGYMPFGGPTVIGQPGDTAAAAALWMPPGHRLNDDFWPEHGADFLAVVGDRAERLGQLSEAMGAHHPGDDHWYLLAIGVDPLNQGAGLGSSMLSHSLDERVANGSPAYLEATSRRSRLLYERHGFETISEFAPVDGPPLWGMWREGS